jgi:cyclase
MNFESIKDVNDPATLAEFYNGAGADELVFYDITATFEGRKLFTDALTRVAEKVFIPLTVGGSINAVDDFERVLSCGADKVSVNSGAIKDPDLIDKAASRYGSQCVVLSMDVKRTERGFTVFMGGGRVDTGKDAIAWAAEGVKRGAGELVINSIDTDGVKQGFDIEMLSAFAEVVSIPIIASGGAGCMEDFKTLFDTVKGVDAGLAASIFHFKTVNIGELKNYLAQTGINVRR